LVKNTLIPIEQRSEKSYSRKIREILLSAEITRRYSKEQILEWYLNTNFLRQPGVRHRRRLAGLFR